MTYKQFKKVMSQIKQIEKSSYKISEALKLIVGDLEYFYLNVWQEQMIDLLKIAMDDRYDYVNYYIYDLDWGKDGNNSVDIDELDYNPTNYRELYNYIKK